MTDTQRHSHMQQSTIVWLTKNCGFAWTDKGDPGSLHPSTTRKHIYNTDDQANTL